MSGALGTASAGGGQTRRRPLCLSCRPLLVQGKVKEIEWHFEQTGPHSGDIYPTVHEYAEKDAPARLMPRGPHPGATAAAAATAVVPALTALEACLLMALVGALLAWLYATLSFRKPSQPETPQTAADPAARIVVADFARWARPGGQHAPPGQPACSVSAFVTKVEVFLRFAGVPYAKKTSFPNAAASPKAQLPYIERGEQTIGDSCCIVKHLISSGTVPAALEFPRSAGDRATAIAVARMCEGDLAMAVVYERQVDDENWLRAQEAMLGPFRLPPIVNWVVARMVRKAVLVRTVEQGYGRHSQADREAAVREQLGALSALLGKQPFLCGKAPHAVDASVFGVVDQFGARDLNPRLADLLEEHPNLVAYRDRIRAQYFGESYQKEIEWLDGPVAAAARLERMRKAAAAEKKDE